MPMPDDLAFDLGEHKSMLETNPMLGVIRSALEAQAQKTAFARKERQETHNHIVRIAMALCRKGLDTVKRKIPGEPEDWSSKALADLIITDVGNILDMVDMGLLEPGALADRVTELQAALDQARAELEQARRQTQSDAARMADLQRQVETAVQQRRIAEQTASNLQQRCNDLQGQLEQARMKPPSLLPTVAGGDAPSPAQQAACGVPPSVPVAGLPDWIQAWRQSESFEKDLTLLELIGKTGECRRSRLLNEVGGQFSIVASAASIKNTVKHLHAYGVIDIEKLSQSGGGKAQGRFPDLLHLTATGRNAFRALFLQEPSLLYDQLLARHKTPEHLYLNLEAADLLSEAGYSIDCTPLPIRLDDESIFDPDLVAWTPSETLYIECERHTAYKDAEDRARKWAITARATGGNIYIITLDRAGMDAIQSEVVYALRQQKLQARVSVTNIADLRAGKYGQNESIWIRQS